MFCFGYPAICFNIVPNQKSKTHLLDNFLCLYTVDNHVTCGQCANRMLQRILMENQYIFAC